MKFIFSLCIQALLVTAFSTYALDDDTELLKQAWSEYRLGEYATARNLFDGVFKKGKGDKSYCEAATGVAFCFQFAKKQQLSASDYRKAIKVYGVALKKVGEASKYAPFFKAMLAECLFEVYKFSGDAKSLKQAEELWEEIQNKWPDTLAAQDSLLFQVVAMTGENYSAPQAAKLAGLLESWFRRHALDRNNGKTAPKALSAVMCAYLSDYYCWRGNKKEEVAWLIRYYDIGATSYAAKADALFKIARTAEVKLKDAKLALKYYRIFLKDIGSDSRRYLVQERIKAILDGGVK
jgi:hypothetical protein